jgi:hypothetical protein
MESARTQAKESKSEPVKEHGRDTSRADSANSNLPLFNSILPAVHLASAYSLSRLPVAGILQTKLTISQPGDKYEQEAESVAERVMRMPELAFRLQRKCGCGGAGSTSGSNCEECAGKSMKLQRSVKAASAHASATHAPHIVHDVLRSPGQSLDLLTRSFFEPRFGYDLSQVRVHADALAAESADAVNARAYTVGNNVVFGAGQYAPGTTEGKHLLAHELTHIIQQRKGETESAAAHRPTETVNRKAQAASSPEHASQSFALSFEIKENAAESALHRSFDVSAIRQARLAGGIERIADFLIQRAGASDQRLARMNQLRARLGGIRNISISRDDAGVFQEIYDRARGSAPRWVPAPRLNFFGALAPPIPVVPVVPPIPIPVLIVILVLVLIIVYLFEEERESSPRPEQQQEIDEVLDRMNEIIRGQRPGPAPAPRPEPEEREPRRPPPSPREEQPCCCCVNNIQILNSANIHTGSRIDDAHHMGHRFQTAFSLSYTGTGEKRSCVLEWCESTNLPYASDWHRTPCSTQTARNFYSNRYRLGGSSFVEWDSRPEPCPGNPPDVIDTDSPKIAKSMGDANRFLRFIIKVHSGAACNCPNPSLEVTARQRLVLRGGVPDWNASDFLVPNPVP